VDTGAGLGEREDVLLRQEEGDQVGDQEGGERNLDLQKEDKVRDVVKEG